MSSNRSELEDKVQVTSGSSTSKEAGVINKEMDGKILRKKILVKKPQPADLSRPISTTKNIKYCIICRTSPSAFDMSHKRVAGLRFKMYKKLHASFKFPSSESKELNFCCEACFESVNHLHKLQEKPNEIKIEIKEVAVKIRTAVQTRIPVNLEFAKSKAFGDCGEETVARPNRTRSTAKTNNGNSSTVTSEEVGLDDDIKIEIKMEDEEIKEEESDDNSLMEKQEYDNYQQTIAAHCTRSNKSNVSQSQSPRLVLVNWDGCIICLSRPSAFDTRNKRVAERRFEVYKKLDPSYRLPTAESTEAKFHFCCETCFEAVNHLHRMQVKLGKVQAEIKVVVARIHNSILSKTPATLELGKLKDCGDKVGRQNRSGNAAAESENFIIGDDDFIKMEIKKEDEIKQEINQIEETDNDNDNDLMDHHDSRARGSSLLDKEVRTVGSRRSVAAGRFNRISTVDIEDITRIEIAIKIEDEIKQEIIEEDDFLAEDSLSEQGNDQRKLIPATGSHIQMNFPMQSHQIPRLVLVNPEGNDADAMESDDIHVDKALEISAPPGHSTPSEKSLPDFASANFEEQLKSLVLAKKNTSANCKPATNRKSDKKQGIRQELREAKLSQKNNQKRMKCKIELNCYFCSKKFSRPSLLERHISTHTFERLHKCTICGLQFTQASNRNSHITQVHDGLRPFECTIMDCSDRFGTKANLTRHMRFHSGEKNRNPVKCHMCEMTFLYGYNIRIHINAVHKKLKPHKCTRKGCISRFAKSADLRRHIDAVHKSLKPFACTVDGCAFRCNQKGDLNRHMLSHGEKQFRCDICQKLFSSKRNVLRHQNKSAKKCNAPNTD